MPAPGPLNGCLPILAVCYPALEGYPGKRPLHDTTAPVQSSAALYIMSCCPRLCAMLTRRAAHSKAVGHLPKFKDGAVSIRRALTSTDNGRHIAFRAPKTRRSRRTIPLTASALNALKVHRKRHLEEMMKLAGLWEGRRTYPGPPLTPVNTAICM